MALLLGLVLLVAVLALVRVFTHWSRHGVAQYPFWKIWCKNVVEFVRQPPLTDAHRQLYQDFEGHRYVGTYQLFRPRLCILDTELIKSIFVKDFDHFMDHTMFIPTDGDPIWENSLFSLRGERWRHMRAVASPSFTSSKMKFMFGLVVESVQQLMDFLDEKPDTSVLEMKDTFSRLTNDAFASTHFGVICDSLKERNNEMYRIGMDAVDFNGFWIKVRFVLIQMMPQVTRMLGLKVFDQKASSFFKRVIKENMQSREEKRITRPDLIHLLMETSKSFSNGAAIANGVVNGHAKTNGLANGHVKANGAASFSNVVDSFAAVKDTPTRIKNMDPLSYDDVTALVMAFFGGGFDSTSSLLSFAVYELALHPEAQEKLQREIDEELEVNSDRISYDRLFGMKYLDMVVTETLRKWPGGFFLDRRCVKPYTIPPAREGEVPVHLRPGDSIWLSLFVLHRDPEIYPDPEKFIPERFSEENRPNLNPYAYMPFGMGPRHCIGNRFALMEIKLVLFHVLAKYTFVPVEKTAIPVRLERRNFQLCPKDGFWLGLKRRC